MKLRIEVGSVEIVAIDKKEVILRFAEPDGSLTGTTVVREGDRVVFSANVEVSDR